MLPADSKNSLLNARQMPGVNVTYFPHYKALFFLKITVRLYNPEWLIYGLILVIYWCQSYFDRYTVLCQDVDLVLIEFQTRLGVTVNTITCNGVGLRFLRVPNKVGSWHIRFFFL